MTGARLEAEPGQGGLPRVTLMSADGESAVVYLHGAHVTSWRTGDGVEQLYLSERAVFDGSAAIRGGIPIIFPQFAGEGPLPKHGFARTARWELVDASAGGSAPFAVLRIADSPHTRAVWPHAFVAELRVSIGDDTLRLALTVTNSGPEAFTFTAALHTYLRVADTSATRVAGLLGLAYRDSADGGMLKQEDGQEVAVAGEVNRIYLGATGPLHVRDGRRSRSVDARGFHDVVLWNPGAQLEAALGDMEPGGSRRMLCVEAAAVGTPVQLLAGETWAGWQSIRTNNG